MIENLLKFPAPGECRIYGYVGKMINYILENQLLDTDTWALLVDQFRVQEDGKNNGWRGEYWGKLMRGGSLTYSATKNEKLYSIMKDSVIDLLSTQEKNGRISSYSTETEFHGWDVWSRKYVMLGLLYFLEICKSEHLAARVLKALTRHADYIIKYIGEGEEKISIFDTAEHVGGLNSCSILEPFVKLYALTEEKKYFDFASYIVGTGFCKDENLIELCISKKQYPYQFPQTKAYEMISCFEGLLEYYRISGEDCCLRAVENFLEMVVQTDYTIIGGCGCSHEYFDNSVSTQTEPAARDVMQETCVTVTFMKLCAKMLALTGNAKYAEYIERSGLNALYGAVNNENQKMARTQARTWIEGGEMVLVTDHGAFPFDSYSPLFQDRRGIRVGGVQILQGGRSYGCCIAIGSAGTALMGLFAVMKSNSGVCINMYSDCYFKTNDSADGISVRVYADPYKSNGAKINVCGAGRMFTVSLRIPSWAESISVMVNGERVQGECKNGYLVLNRVWNNEKLELKFKSRVKMSVINKKIAFTKGPIVLARDTRFDDISKPVVIGVKNGRNVRAKKIRNNYFSSNLTLQVSTKEGSLTLCDYAQAGKNYDDEKCGITVWQARE